MKLVPRYIATSTGHGEVGHPIVTDSDASRLEEVIEAADEMRRELICPLVGKKAGRCDILGKPCWACQCAIEYDAKRKAVGEK